ncbi:MAG: PfkB family carbohydrate kinase [Acidobacteriota bacterium]
MADQTEVYGNLLRQFSGKQVLVIGDLMLDTYLHCGALGVANEAPVPLLEALRQEDVPGGAANVACNLAALGVATELIGVIGQDQAAESLCSRIKASGVVLHELVTERPTTHKTRILSEGHYYLRVDDEGSSTLSESEWEGLVQIIEERSRQHEVVVISDYAKGVVQAKLSPVLARSCPKNSTILADLKPSSVLSWKGPLDVLTPNAKEAQQLFSGLKGGSLPPPQGLAQTLSQKLNCCVVLTQGSEGMTVASSAGALWNYPAVSQGAWNTSGAGDTVLAVLAAATACGAPIEQAARLANLAAGLAVSTPHTHAVSANELAGALVQL